MPNNHRDSDKKVIDEMTAEQIEEFRVRKIHETFCDILNEIFSVELIFHNR